LAWPDGNLNDIDAWVQGPSGELVWFRAREAGLMHLDRDDRGAENDSIVVNGRTLVNPINQEVITIRGIAPGEYVVNAHYYESKDSQPVDVTLTVVKINPKAEVVYHGQQNLQRKGDEATMVRFSISSDGAISNISTLQKKLVSGAGK
jgi:hypothetical protein